ncbi:hypothetical protein [Parvularcula dongshanensis]|uniref:Putative tellurite resistance protein B-like protein n=1 Tax=Parvularcula dongshanensis TaxID=1173995 RepID=A0A840I2E6_9PROT|nr:hypothetical protein [Parvularcula dongshanensis]MBB4658453.1 putative tellurite resistance protein B-like protein [Parvularcula dongshanensis]
MAALSPRAGAAGLLMMAVGGEDATEIERDAVDAVLMKLFLLTRPKTAQLRAEAEGADAESAAEAARVLDADEKERLVSALWQLGGDGEAMRAVQTRFGLSEERLAALKPTN